MKRPNLALLTAVELRKLVDTRAGRWLLGLIAFCTVAIMVVQLIWMPDAEQTAMNLFLPTLLPAAVLLPVLGILLLTSEWSQRTAVHTFALVPQRWRVLVAKVGAGMASGIAAVLFGLAVAATGTVVADLTGGAGTWNLTGTVIAQGVLFQLLNVVMGVSFGAMLLSSPVAIVLYFVLPILWSTLGGMIAGLRRPAEWLDLNTTLAPFVEPVALTGGQWARAGTALALWLLLPLIIGTFRVLRSEIK
jgi:ABC-type transport system involved in multi-copper enzyme maturation permease subunit